MQNKKGTTMKKIWAVNGCDEERAAWMKTAYIATLDDGPWNIAGMSQAEEAMRMLNQKDFPDLMIISDRPMPPGVGGHYLMKWAKNMIKDLPVERITPVIFICSSPESFSAATALADKVLLNPSMDEIGWAIMEQLEKSVVAQQRQ